MNQTNVPHNSPPSSAPWSSVLVAILAALAIAWITSSGFRDFVVRFLEYKEIPVERYDQTNELRDAALEAVEIERSESNVDSE